ncbi:ferredoxin-nitrite reductase [Pseudoscourfieldia marina]
MAPTMMPSLKSSSLKSSRSPLPLRAGGAHRCFSPGRTTHTTAAASGGDGGAANEGNGGGFWSRLFGSANSAPLAAATVEQPTASSSSGGLESRYGPKTVIKPLPQNPPNLDVTSADAFVGKTPQGSWQLLDEGRAKNPFEKTKLQNDALELLKRNGGFDELTGELTSTTFEDIYTDEEKAKTIDVRLKWMGLFHRLKAGKGRFMLRLRLPNGVLNSEQCRYMDGVISKYGEEQGCADVTTRENLQLRGITLEDAPEILSTLESLGITTLQSGMDNVRNVAGSPLAGIDPEETYDTRAMCQALTEYVTQGYDGNPAISNLPRKFNICVVGSADMFEHPHINDIALVPAKSNDNGKLGFHVEVGGFLSSTRCTDAIPLDAFVAEADAAALCHAILTTFRDYGVRGPRTKTRLMWCIDEMGFDNFRDEVARRMPGGNLPRASEATTLLPKLDERRVILGIHDQKQDGLQWAGLCVPTGSLEPGDMTALADAADTFGSGEVRLTVDQNVIIPNIPKEKMDAFLNEPIVQKFTPFPGVLVAGLVSCTGARWCPQAQIHTKSNALELAQRLDEQLSFPKDTKEVRMHWSGCPNVCGQSQVGDIGFIGTSFKVKKDEKRVDVEGVNLLEGGRICQAPAEAQVVDKKVPLGDELEQKVKAILMEKYGAVEK